MAQLILRLGAAGVLLAAFMIRANAQLPDGIGASVDGAQGSFRTISPQEKLDMQFFSAVNNGDLEGMEAALEAGADIDAVHRVSEQAQVPAIMHASLAGNLEVIKYLLDEGADPEVPDSFGFTAIHGAAFKGMAET